MVKVDIRLDQFPEVFPPGTILGSITPAAAEACDFPVGLPMVVAYQLQTPNYEGMAHRYDLKVSGVESMIPSPLFDGETILRMIATLGSIVRLKRKTT